jgi:hypothetical protein
MQIEKYETETDYNKLEYTFSSIGRAIIKKKIVYEKFEEPEDIGLPFNTLVYNLGFGDLNELTGRIDDKIASNNGDMDKILATVAETAFNFWEKYPRALIYFRGSSPTGQESLRTYLYQKKINRYFDEISNFAEVFGLTINGWEEFVISENYMAFLILRKD